MRVSGAGLVRLSLLAACALTACAKEAPVVLGGKDAGQQPDDDRDADVSDAAAQVDASGRVFNAGDESDRNTAVPGHLCARVAAIECAGEAVCCDAAARDGARCLEQREAACIEQLALDALSSAPEVGFEVKLASAALAEFEHRASTCDPQIAAWFWSPEGLAASFAGTLGKGDACGPIDDADAEALAIATASCQLTANLACAESAGADAWTCAQRMSPQGSCLTDRSCADGLYCDTASSTDGVCHERLPEAAACTRAAQCISLLCHAGKCAADDDEQAAYCP